MKSALLAAILACSIGIFATKAHARHEGAANGEPPAVRSTLRVGMWTLWRDRTVVVAPGAGATLRLCIGCPARSLKHNITIRAESGGDLSLGPDLQADALEMRGVVTLTAHGESETIDHPVRISARDGVLVIAVTLPVESYVERVVESESGAEDSAESLKALAIVVRSYALHEAHGHADFDVCDSTHCQLLHWQGAPEKRAAAHFATLTTAGETLWFRGGRARAYFNKDCGGRTAGVKEVWPKAPPAPYLASHADRYCNAQDSKAWASELTRSELTSALAAHGVAPPGWQRLSVDRRGESGRAISVNVDGREIAAEEFRLAVGESLGWNRIPSTWFEVSQQGDRFFFHGRGWGHGVGLCQKGAAMMAKEGRPAGEILAQYFPGAEARDERTGNPWKTYAGSGLSLETLDAADASHLRDLGRARAEASVRSGLNPALRFTVRVFASTPAFRDATLAPGWVAAFAEGDWIGCQPLRTLAARNLLADTMRHEFLHGLVEHEAGPRAPLWLREGLVEGWASNPGGADHGAAPAMTMEAVNAALAHPGSEAESELAHQSARVYAGRLLDRFGRTQVLAWLRSGVPADVLAGIQLR